MFSFDVTMSTCMSVLPPLYITIAMIFKMCHTYENLALNKKAEQSSVYAEDIDPNLAVDNNTDQTFTNCARTTLASEVWWQVDLGGKKSIHDIRVFYRNDSDANVNIRVGNHAGFSLYISESRCELPTGGYLCYKNQDKLPPLESDHVCKHHGRYVTYYNKRTGDGADFPFKVTSLTETMAEICEVQVFGCSVAGMYGESCDEACPINCRDNLCDIETGACLNCNEGFKGEQCDVSASPLTGSSESELSLYKGVILTLTVVLVVLIVTVVILHYKLSKLKSIKSQQSGYITTQPEPGSQGHTYATLGVELAEVRQYDHLRIENQESHSYLRIV
uniref:Uncharacterized protein LOC111123725 n=1 Tax=Crassostrea virginica TaxID=6565 RepID=A0A8B8D2J4_CRAVI|nr:uncharacterized protein LOC111123725 [Crassostrea virginica]